MTKTRKADRKESFFVSITAWKKAGVKKIAQENAINLSQLIENYLDQHFGEKLKAHKPNQESKSNITI